MTKQRIDKLVRLLVDAVANVDERASKIDTFQRNVWNHDIEQPVRPEAAECLLGLAYHLDYYEPNESHRREDPSFYGDQQAALMIFDGLRDLETMGIHIPWSLLREEGDR